MPRKGKKRDDGGPRADVRRDVKVDVVRFTTERSVDGGYRHSPVKYIFDLSRAPLVIIPAETGFSVKR